ncbi:MAG: RNA polymerase factor sigma-54 [Methylobacter sp.]|nr:RNA polymerase factor sigma-54 [Methylobacter sp.]MDP2098346.1 RNA polymerase factor sigma-54 [Methylobacter sp.]MDP2430174.1 RNA polymerase factor sigma-54 [Methylobacter sp.]MDP3056359.1 RNA polymerase factor sigma-54 [Methylobacter sp.]MDP3363301.1 RNA polymerase factor sigma-54 [Methylobacter sp.]
MKQSLNLRLGQQLSMTPQLQQAIKLLQMSTLELQQEIQQALESNMMLEVNEEENSVHETEITQEKKIDNTDLLTSQGSQTEMPDELPIDSSWDDIYEYAMESGGNSAETVEFETQRSKSSTLLDHLLWQVELTSFSDRDHAIALAIIDSINEDGYLLSSPEDIFQGLQTQLDDLDFDEVNAVLHRVQNFDPVGVAAIDLKDCLRLQILQLPEATPYKEEALTLVTRYLDLLATHEQSKLMRKLGVTERQLDEVVALIRTLDPKPGAQIQDSDSEYVIPDVYVVKQGGKWQVNLNPDIAPKLRINPFYSGMIKRADNSKDNACMKDHLQEARWFIKSLHSRNDTLLRVARCIVEKQSGFLEHGSIAMKSMVLRDIAEELELHESTISRVTTQKFMHTPNGIVEFKYFFSSHVSTEGGGECSSTAIRAFIKELISNENLAKPLSDSKIAELLQEKGINVARRTVAKYREAMLISSSSQRKRLL